MNLIFPDQGLDIQLGRILAATALYHLYTNNLSPNRDTILSDLTEAAWTGYATHALTDADFPIIGVAAHKGYAIGTPISFTNGSGSTVTPYGYYVTDSGATKLLAIARFDGAPSSIIAGGSLSVVPTWGDFSELSS